MKDMKKMNKIMIRAVGVLIVCLLPLVAFAQQDWKSTSTMTGSGSAYMPEVTAVGATSATSESTTSDSHSSANAPSGRRKTLINGPESGQGLSPIGDAVLPLMLMAFAFGGVVYFRRRRTVE